MLCEHCNKYQCISKLYKKKRICLVCIKHIDFIYYCTIIK